MLNIKNLVWDNLNQAIQEWRWWEYHNGPNWKNRIVRFSRSPLKYTVLQLSKIIPIKVSIKTFWGATMRCYFPDYFYTSVFGLLRDVSEINLTKFIINNFKSDGIFFDIGASCGFYTLLASSLINNNGQVHAFEPTTWVFLLLRHNVVGLPNIFINEVAISNNIGMSTFHTYPIFAVKNSLVQRRSARFKTTITTDTLDRYCRQRSLQPTFVKIDVEGAEDKVVDGALNVFRDSYPIVAMEMRRNRNEPHIKAANKMLELGYWGYCLKNNGQLERINKINYETVNEIIPENSIYTNIIFKRST